MAILNLKRFGFNATGEEIINDLPYQVCSYKDNPDVILKKYVKKPNINMEIYIGKDKFLELVDYDYDTLCSGFSAIVDRLKKALEPKIKQEVEKELEKRVTEQQSTESVTNEEPKVLPEFPYMNAPEFNGPILTNCRDAFIAILIDIIKNANKGIDVLAPVDFDKYDLSALSKKDITKLMKDLEAVRFSLKGYLQKN